jgi:outer membrane protein W
MKKTCCTFLFLSAVMLSNAQDRIFKPFKVDIAAGYAIPSGKGSKAGGVFAVEPKYAVNDNISLGLRLEVAATARGYIRNGQEFSGDVKASASYLATGDYYFNTNRFRPFAGAGAGVYSLASANFDATMEEVNEDDVTTGSKFGFAPRAGFEYGHFRTAIEYNAIGKSGNINNNYLSIKVGFSIGGGRY